MRDRQSPDLLPAENRAAGYRYGIVLLLIFATFVFMAVGASGRWTRVVTVGLQGLTLLAALVASGASRHYLRISGVVVATAWAGAIGSTISGTDTVSGCAYVLNFLLVAAVPVVIIRSVAQRRVVDIRTVLGAICVYVLLGMMWSFAYAAIGDFSTDAFFAQLSASETTTADYLYFSYVTLATLGYGDLTAASDVGRTFAVLEALLGQLYLVTIIALLVSRLGSRPIEKPEDQ